MLNASAEDKEETNVPIFYYRDAQDGYKAGTNYLSTGIGIKKFVHPKDLADSEKSYDVSRVVQKVRSGHSICRDSVELCRSTE